MKPAEYIALVSIVASFLVGFGSLAWQTRAKRRDDKRAAQLERLARQLSDLYGPLYALYEAGERNWLQFVALYSHDTKPLGNRAFLPREGDWFPPPDASRISEYRRRMEQLFMPTNERMEILIAEHASLLVGKRMPEEFSDFLAHTAAAKLMVHRWRTDPRFGTGDWAQHHVEYDHPWGLKHRIRASFEVLKETQQRMLSGTLDSVDETEIERRITRRMAEVEHDWQNNGPSYLKRLKSPPEHPGTLPT